MINFFITVQDIPPIPIKTYRWEDVRRAKKQGAYPYTHLLKSPYYEEIDPEEFTMEAFRRRKSSSTGDKSESDVVIEEITNGTNEGNKDFLSVVGTTEGIIESAESSIDEGPSLERDPKERPQITEEKSDVEEDVAPGPSQQDNGMGVDVDEGTVNIEGRAKSEEPKRKRKHSVESSYSRISLSRLGIVKKLREAKEKLKLPRFNFSKSDSKLNAKKEEKKELKKSPEKTKVKKTLTTEKPTQPLYIHIPLKPPPGQTDEFSYLEFEEYKNDESLKRGSPVSSLKDKDAPETVLTEDPNDSRRDVQFIILTAPSDDEVLHDQNITPDTPPTDQNKFFNNSKLKELKSLAKNVVDEISPNIEGIIFEDVIQVEYVDENNKPIGTAEQSKFMEVTEENLSKLEKKLSSRNLAGIGDDISSSMDNLNKIVRTLSQKREKKRNGASKEPSPSKSDDVTITERGKDVESILKVKDKNKLSIENLFKSKNTFRAEDKELVVVKDNTTTQAEVKNETAQQTNKQAETEDTSKSYKFVKKKPNKRSDEMAEMSRTKSKQANVKETKITVDEEDGLKSEEPVNLTGDKEKLSTKQDDVAGKVKKVSFKRKSKREDPDGIYEDVQVSSSKKIQSDGKGVGGDSKQMEQSQSMSIDEEKSYLDEKVVKLTSLDEDYHKWSKLP